MKTIATEENSNHIFSLIIGIFLSLWSANKAMKASSQGLNVVNEKSENRGFLLLNITTLLLTFFTSLVMIYIMLVTVLLPILASHFLSQDSAEILTLAAS